MTFLSGDVRTVAKLRLIWPPSAVGDVIGVKTLVVNVSDTFVGVNGSVVYGSV